MASPESPNTVSDVSVKCEHCGEIGRAGVDVHPFDVAFKVTLWLHRRCEIERRAETASGA